MKTKQHTRNGHWIWFQTDDNQGPQSFTTQWVCTADKYSRVISHCAVNLRPRSFRQQHPQRGHVFSQHSGSQRPDAAVALSIVVRAVDVANSLGCSGHFLRAAATGDRLHKRFHSLGLKRMFVQTFSKLWKHWSCLHPYQMQCQTVVIASWPRINLHYVANSSS